MYIQEFLSDVTNPCLLFIDHAIKQVISLTGAVSGNDISDPSFLAEQELRLEYRLVQQVTCRARNVSTHDVTHERSDVKQARMFSYALHAPSV